MSFKVHFFQPKRRVSKAIHNILVARERLNMMAMVLWLSLVQMEILDVWDVDL